MIIHLFRRKFADSNSQICEMNDIDQAIESKGAQRIWQRMDDLILNQLGEENFGFYR